MKLFKTRLLMAFILLILLPSIVSAQDKSFAISGSLKNMVPMPSKVYMSYDAIIKRGTDSALVKDGKYMFKGIVDISVPVTLSMKAGETKQAGSDAQYVLMLDNGAIDIVSDGALGNAVVTGPGANANTEFHKAIGFSATESAAIKNLMKTEGYETNEALKKEVQSRSTALLGNTLVNLISYIRKNPDSPASPYLTYSLFAIGFLTQEMTDTLNQLFPTKLRGSSVGLAIDEVLKKQSESRLESKAKADNDAATADALTPLGSKAPDFTQNNVEGSPVSLSSFRGKYVLIDFWASWCAPCREENPSVVKAFHAYKDRGFTVLGVSLDWPKGKQAWVDAIAKDGLAWTQVSDLRGGNNQAALLYGVKAIPQNFLIDPNGVIVAKNLRGDALEKKLAELIK